MILAKLLVLIEPSLSLTTISVIVLLTIGVLNILSVLAVRPPLMIKSSCTVIGEHPYKFDICKSVIQLPEVFPVNSNELKSVVTFDKPPLRPNTKSVPLNVPPVTYEFVSSNKADTSTVNVWLELVPLKNKFPLKYVPPLT